MRKAVFLVYESRGGWWIDLDGRATGPHASRAVAIARAIPMAQARQAGGMPAEVLAPGDDHRHHVAWPPGVHRRRVAPSLAS